MMVICNLCLHCSLLAPNAGTAFSADVEDMAPEDGVLADVAEDKVSGLHPPGIPSPTPDPLPVYNPVWLRKTCCVLHQRFRGPMKVHAHFTSLAASQSYRACITNSKLDAR
jgi:hypothetical protein